MNSRERAKKIAVLAKRIKDDADVIYFALHVAEQIDEAVEEAYIKGSSDCHKNLGAMQAEAYAQGIKDAESFVLHLPTHPQKFSPESASIIANGIRALTDGGKKHICDNSCEEFHLALERKESSEVLD